MDDTAEKSACEEEVKRLLIELADEIKREKELNEEFLKELASL